VRILALDVGDRRIGVALSDPSGTLASALTVIERSAKERDLRKIAALADEHQVAQVVVGLPRRMDGTVGEQAEKVQAFARGLQRFVSQPVVFWDERLTTAAAERMMIEAGMKRAKRRARIDAAAAALILQGYLDYLAASRAAGREPTW